MNLALAYSVALPGERVDAGSHRLRQLSGGGGGGDFQVAGYSRSATAGGCALCRSPPREARAHSLTAGTALRPCLLSCCSRRRFVVSPLSDK